MVPSSSLACSFLQFVAPIRGTSVYFFLITDLLCCSLPPPLRPFTLQELEASLIAAKQQEQQELLAKRDLEGEVRSYLAASTMLKQELDAV